MKDIEKAIDWLSCERDNYSKDSAYYYYMGLAISTLEKQIPKRPLYDDDGGYPEYFERWLACPICDEAIPEYTAENNTWCYCLGCGQKLDWLEVENE